MHRIPARIGTAALLCALAAIPAGAQPDSAHDSHLAVGQAVPDTFYFETGLGDLVELFERHEFTIDTWQAGDRSVPRLYLTQVPSSWRKEVAPALDVVTKKRYFFFVYAPLVLECNEDIMGERERLLALAEQERRSAEEEAWLRELASRYRVLEDAGDPLVDDHIERLKSRVDEVPPSLALAQAAVESGWSTSRFADEGNALFGQWTWGEDGITPEEQRGQLGDYKIRAFATPEESIAAYMHNLNTHRSYEDFRRRREDLRSSGKPLQGAELAPTLTSYSEKGEEYTELLLSMIRVNRLAPVDGTYLRDMKPVLLVPLGEDSE
jgi:uncharacterized FlgJ-related protein